MKVQKTFSSGEFHYVYGEVYAPDIVDTDGESMTAEDIQKMAHDFIASGLVRALDTEHNNQLCGAEIVESFIARKGDPDYAEGAWVLGVRMTEGPLWERVKSGDLNSFSVEALVTKVPSDRELPNLGFVAGTTLLPVAKDGVEPHKHAFFLQFDNQGRVVFGKTDVVADHYHEIIGTVTTEQAMGHAHRFFLETA